MPHAHVLYILLRIKAPGGFFAGRQWLEAAAAIQLVGTEGKTQPLAP